MTDLHQRLRTMLFLVPYVVHHQGVELGKLASRLGLTEAELQKEIDFLLMVGRPPFQPNDFLDIYQEGGRVFVDLHQSLERPPQLTIFEALALACAAQLFAGQEEAYESARAVRVAVEKIIQSLPDEARQLFEQLASHYLIVAGSSATRHLTTLRQAAEQHREVEILHFAASRKKEAWRTVRPHGFYHKNGAWYLAAYCTQRQAERVFRLSRIREAEITDRKFDPPEDFDVSAFVEKSITVPASGKKEVSIRFSPEVSRWIQERWGPQYLTHQEDGSVIGRLHDVSDEYVLSYVASLGGAATIVSPVELANRLHEQAREALALYE
jgi:proteasome accessory factor C